MVDVNVDVVIDEVVIHFVFDYSWPYLCLRRIRNLQKVKNATLL